MILHQSTVMPAEAGIHHPYAPQKTTDVCWAPAFAGAVVFMLFAFLLLGVFYAA